MDNKLNLYLTGRGRPVVLLHSLLSDRASFDRLAPALAEKYQVIVPDLPGFGASISGKRSLVQSADLIASLVRTFAADGEATIVGNGFGAFVALQAAILYPSLPFRLVLVGCGARFSDAGREAFRKMASAASERGLEAVADTAMNRLFAADFQAANPDLMRDRRDAFLRTDPNVFGAACEALANLDLTAAVSAVRCPTLVIVGENDQATPPEMARDLVERLPRARLQVLEGCAHVPPLQAPDRLFALIDHFIAQEGAVAEAELAK